MNRSVVSRIHHDKFLLETVFTDEWVIRTRHRSDVMTVGPVRNVRDVVGRQTLHVELTFHALSDNDDLIHATQRPQTQMIEQSSEHSFTNHASSDGQFRKEVLEPTDRLDRLEA